MRVNLALCYRIIFLIGFILAASAIVRAERLPVKTYTTADGLVSNKISRITRDSRGYLWFCTEDGLSRFDGYGFTNYSTQQGLPTNWIDDFLETRGGIFLVATTAGLCVFDPKGVPVTGIKVEGNFIGTNASGTAALGNLSENLTGSTLRPAARQRHFFNRKIALTSRASQKISEHLRSYKTFAASCCNL